MGPENLDRKIPKRKGSSPKPPFFGDPFLLRDLLKVAPRAMDEKPESDCDALVETRLKMTKFSKNVACSVKKTQQFRK